MDSHRPLKDKTDQSLLTWDTQSPSPPNLDVGIQKNQGWETLSFRWTSSLLCPFQNGTIWVQERDGGQKIKLWRRLAKRGPSRITILCMLCQGQDNCTISSDSPGLLDNSLTKCAPSDSPESHPHSIYIGLCYSPRYMPIMEKRGELILALIQS